MRIVAACVFIALAIGALLTTASAAPSPSSQSSDRAALGPVTHTYPLRRGVKLTTITYPSVPNEVRVIQIIPSKGPTLDPVVGSWAWPLYSKVSTMAVGNEAIAAVNGDFARSFGGTKHISMIDGELWTTGSQPGPAFAMSEDGTRAYVGFPQLDIKLTTNTGARLVNVQEWNAGDPTGGANGYTARAGPGSPPPGTTDPQLSDTRFCAVRLSTIKGSGLEWSGAGRKSIVRRYRIVAQPEPCEKTPLSLGTEPHTVVLAARAGTDAAARIRAMTPGQRVKMRWTFAEWPGVADVVGAMPMLVNNTENVGPPYRDGANHILWYNPRTTVGVNRGCTDKEVRTICKIYLLTVDGRQVPEWSKGMMFPDVADELLKLNVWDAANLDGGGSTEVWVKRRNDAYCTYRPPAGGCLANDPSYTFAEERTITNILSVLPGPDPGTPAGLE